MKMMPQGWPAVIVVVVEEEKKQHNACGKLTSAWKPKKPVVVIR